MDYSLAEKLRKVGFPFKQSEGETMIIEFPSAIELREACGDKLSDIHGYYEDYGNARYEYWLAQPNLALIPNAKEIKAETQEEALALFYLQVNKK